MKKLQSLALYALATPVLALGAGSALAQPSTGFDIDRAQLIAQRDQGATQSTTGSRQGDQSSSRRDSQSGSQSATDRRGNQEQSRMQNRGHMNTTPANGRLASNLMGTDVKTSDGEKVGSVDDLIIDNNGQVVAIIVGVGGFLGMGQKDVSIGWDNISQSGRGDDNDLRVDVTRQALRNAPEFKKRD